MPKHDVSKLPKWAQDKIRNQQDTIDVKQALIKSLRGRREPTRVVASPITGRIYLDEHDVVRFYVGPTPKDGGSRYIDGSRDDSRYFDVRIADKFFDGKHQPAIKIRGGRGLLVVPEVSNSISLLLETYPSERGG